MTKVRMAPKQMQKTWEAQKQQREHINPRLDKHKTHNKQVVDPFQFVSTAMNADFDYVAYFELSSLPPDGQHR